MDSRTRIIAATIDCLGRVGLEHTSISAVAQRARVSRPTVYAHFGTRDELISAALEAIAVDILSRVMASAHDARTAADYVVASTMAAVQELRHSPALALMTGADDTGRMFVLDALTARNLALAQQFLHPLLRYQPDLEPDLAEIAETMVRFVLSLLLIDSAVSSSEESLRRYLYRRLVPALGVSTEQATPPRT